MPTNPNITMSTNSSITLVWNYPPPPSAAIEKFLVNLIWAMHSLLNLSLMFPNHSGIYDHCRLHIQQKLSGEVLKVSWSIL